MAKKVVLAYSGGLDTSIIIHWLKENYGCEVIAMAADVGQGDDMDAVVAKAYATGAEKAVVRAQRNQIAAAKAYNARLARISSLTAKIADERNKLVGEVG